MISITDSTTEQASEFSVSLQLDLYLNQRANMVYAPSSIYIAQRLSTPLTGSALPFVCPYREWLEKVCRVIASVGKQKDT